MASAWFSLMLLLAASGRDPVVAREAQAHVLAEKLHAQPVVRLPRGLLDGLVGAVLSPVLDAGGNECSSARGDSLNIGATLPLGISAGISGSSANAHTRQGCGASAGSSSGGLNSGSASTASAGGNGYSAGGSYVAAQAGQRSGAHGGNEGYGQGHRQHIGGEAKSSGSAGTGVGWESQSGSHAVSGSTGQSRPSVASNGPGNGNDFRNSGGYVGGSPVRGEAASVSESSSQSASASFGHGISATGEYGQGNLGDEFSGYDGGHVHTSNQYGIGSSSAGGHDQGTQKDGLNQGEGSGLIGGVVSSSYSTSKASSSAGSSAGARPGASHSSSRSDANSSSRSHSFLISA
ncbi:uncharacterized protein LOC126161639 isoform X2 [Schistocerca cancellata]|uniref:uncharacterized protein LOC126161639 isoform X2 n=1 Tax=Schistocerca cancellata TaxID=274614 RepID=UPI002117D139|nr:uncharacterized protein LOC126161639 isoform X2 [Schistocerca cancellata]